MLLGFFHKSDIEPFDLEVYASQSDDLQWGQAQQLILPPDWQLHTDELDILEETATKSYLEETLGKYKICTGMATNISPCLGL